MQLGLSHHRGRTIIVYKNDDAEVGHQPQPRHHQKGTIYMDSNTKVKTLKTKVPAMTITISLRARVMYARLLKYGYPVTAKRAAELLGGLVQQDTAGKVLKELQEAGLAKYDKATGWTVVKPQEAREKFKWCGDFPFYFTLYPPVENPFPGQKNAVELCAMYFYLLHNQKRGVWQKKAEIARNLGINVRTVGTCLDTLAEKGLQSGRRITKKLCQLQTVDAAPPVRKKPRPNREEEMKRKAVALESALGLSEMQIAKEREDAARTHAKKLDAGQYRGGSVWSVYRWRLANMLKRRQAAGEVVRVAQKMRFDAAVKVMNAQMPDEETERRREELSRIISTVVAGVRLEDRGAARTMLKDTDPVVVARVAAAVKENNLLWLALDELKQVMTDPATAPTLVKTQPQAKKTDVKTVHVEEDDYVELPDVL